METERKQMESQLSHLRMIAGERDELLAGVISDVAEKLKLLACICTGEARHVVANGTIADGDLLSGWEMVDAAVTRLHTMRAMDVRIKEEMADLIRTLADAELWKGDTKPVTWIRCSEQLPAIGILVETKVDDSDGRRNVQFLRRGGDNGRLWFVPDNSMYVYYAPTHWRPVSQSGERQQ